MALNNVFIFVGAEDVIAFNIDTEDRFSEEQHILFKELSIRPEFDVIFFTTPTDYNKEFIQSFVSTHGVIVDTVEPKLASDKFGELTKLVYLVKKIISNQVELIIVFV